MIDAGDGLTPMALPAGEVGPDDVDVSGLFDVAFFATRPLVEPDCPVGIRQPGAYAHLGR
jgi:hypothetical protein